MKKKLIVLFALLSLSVMSYCGETEPSLQGHHLGAGGGLTLGYGLTYRYWPEKWGWQVSFTPIWNSYDLRLTLGGAAVMTLHETSHTRLFLYGGGHYSFNNDFGGEWEEDEGGISHDMGLGTGPGIELILFDNFALDLMFGYGFNTETGGLGFTGEGFLFYRF